MSNWAKLLNWKGPGPSPSPPNCSKGYCKLLPLLISTSWPSLITSWVVIQKIYLKMYFVSCTNTHRDVTDSLNHGMVKNTKTWISSERSIIFLRNKKILNLCLRRHILRSYYFAAEVTFKFPEFWSCVQDPVSCFLCPGSCIMLLVSRILYHAS